MSSADVDDAPEPTKVVALGNGVAGDGRKTGHRGIEQSPVATSTSTGTGVNRVVNHAQRQEVSGS